MNNDLDLTDIPQEGTPIGEEATGADESEKDTTEDSSSKENQTEEPASPPAGEEPSTEENKEEDKNVPFHKDPKVQSYIDRQVDRRLTDTLEQIKEGQNKMVEALTYEPPKEEPIPQWFKNLYATGNTEQDQRNWTDYKTARESERAEDREAIRREQQQERQKEQTNQTEAEQAINSQVSEMQEEGMKFDPNALKKWLLDYHTNYGALPVTNGVIDMRKGLQLMQKMTGQASQSKVTAKREVASKAGSERGGVEPEGSDKTPISKRGWFNYTS